MVITTSDKALGFPFSLPCLYLCIYVQNKTRVCLLNLCSGLIASDISPSSDLSAVSKHELFDVI